MGFCGDMGSAYDNGDVYWSDAQAMLNTVTNSELVANGYIYTTGNHEYSNGNYGSTTNATASCIQRHGEAAVNDNYIIYCFGAASSSQEFTEDDRETLDAYLDNAPDDIPIIILSHFPIHYFPGRTTTYAVDLISILNEHPNVIFLWGHNHSMSDTNYSVVYTAGSSIQYASSTSSTEEINFTYAAAGCMSDKEYTSSSAAIKQKGLIMEVAPAGSSVTMTYYGLDGSVVGSSTEIEIAEDAVSKNAKLSSLSYSLDGLTYTAVPGFSASDTDFDITLPYGTADGPITLSGVCSSKDADITTNAGAVLSSGEATASITVTAEDGTTTQTYTIHFTVSTTQGDLYTPVNDFTDGGEYIIAYVENGTAHCLDADAVSIDNGTTAIAATEPVFAETIITSDESIIWTVDKSGNGWYISPANGSNQNLKLYMGSSSKLYMSASGRAMAYSNSKISYQSSYSTYYQTYSDGSFANTSTAPQFNCSQKLLELTVLIFRQPPP